MDSGEAVTTGLTRSRRAKRPGPNEASQLFDDCEVRPKAKPDDKPAAEPSKRVTVLNPYSVAYGGTAYWGGSVAEVPESVAAEWLKSRWVTEDIGD